MRCHTSLPVLLLALMSWSTPGFAGLRPDEEMTRIAASSGCLLCHNIRPPAAPAQANPPTNTRYLPFGPVWRDVSKKYKNQKGAAARLTRTVLQGSGPKPGDRHWGKDAAGRGMPSNAGDITEANARKLVRWILSLDR